MGRGSFGVCFCAGGQGWSGMGAVVIGVSAWLVVTLSCARWPLLPLRPAHPCFSLNSQPLNHHPRTDPPPLALESPHPFHNIQDKLASDCDPTPPSPLLSHPVFRKLIYPLSLPLPPRLVLHTTFHLHHLLATLIVAPPSPPNFSQPRRLLVPHNPPSFFTCFRHPLLAF